PILAHESDKSIMGIYRLIGGFAGIASFFLESKSPQKTRMIVDKIDSLSELYNQSIPVKEYFYRSIIGAAKEIGSLRGVEAVELFEDPDYSDCVQGKAFLMRPLAEKLLEVSQICERSVFDLQRCSREFIKNNCNITGDQFEYDYIIPTPEAVDTLHSAVKKYKSGEFKRIYSRYIL
ncbi:MAG: hypothetical protein U9R34_05860, partial [Nanoarchaeota archaeon]|nr:hypothetical protein [Nanoarchaeota archaeon]